ncbi:MAG: hypothetical protein O3A55_06025 [Bacteroidetes bacterium]|nr:hypothetical protein [Bacteroidota bacterium]
MSSILHTAVVFEWDQVFCVELEFRNNKYSLNSFGTYTSQINTDKIELLLNNQEPKKIIITELSQFLAKNKFKSKNISFGLNSAMMFVETLPFDISLTKEEKIEHVTWELYQHFYHDKSVSYESDVFYVQENKNQAFEETISVSIRQDLIWFFNDVAVGCGKELNIINVDHFGAEQSVLHNYPEDILNPFLIINCDEETTDFTIMQNGSPVFTITLNNSDEIILKINEQILKYKLSKIFLHGRALNPQFHELLVSKSQIPVQLIDPFKKIEIPKSFAKQIEQIEVRQKFTSAIGLALRIDK